MPRMENKAISQQKDSPPQEKSWSGDMKVADLFRMLCERIDSRFDQQENKLDGIMKMTRGTSQRVSSLEQDARQPRLAMEADGPANKKIRERTEGAATAVQAMNGDSCSVDRVDPDPMCSTRSGDDCTGPPAPPCSGENTLVDNHAAVPKSFLPSLEMRLPTAAGGLLPTGEISTATKTTFNKSPLRLYSTEETNTKEANLWTSVPSAWYHSSFWKLLAAPLCRRVIETESMQNRTFDPGGSQDRLRACPFLETWRALLCGRFMLGLSEAAAFSFGGLMIEVSTCRRMVRTKFYAVRIAVICWLLAAGPVLNAV